jgi:hypothetical protein
MRVIPINAQLVRVERRFMPDLYAKPPRVGSRWLNDATDRAVCPLVQAAIDRALSAPSLPQLHR